jgi:hypothetical protein
MGFDREHLCFFRSFGFRREWREALLSISIMDMSFLFYGEVRGGEWHGRQDLRTSVFGSRLCNDGQLAWCFILRSNVMQVGALTHEKFNVLHFMVKI